MVVEIENSKLRIVNIEQEEVEKALKVVRIVKNQEKIYLRRGSEFPLGAMYFWNLKPTYIDKTIKPDTEINPDFNLYDAELRDYQKEAVSALLKDRVGWIELPPGTGKTYIMSSLIKSLGMPKTLILAPTVDLCYQLRNEISMLLNEHVGYKYFQYIEDSKIFVTTYAALMYRPAIYRDFECLIVDEAHHVTGMKLFFDLWECNAYYRYGFTATGSTDVRVSRMLNLTFGPRSYGRYLPELENYLPQVELVLYDLEYTDPRLKLYDINRLSRGQRIWLEIMGNPYRNKIIVDLVSKFLNLDKNILILCSQLKHCHILSKLLKDYYNIDSPILHSGTPRFVRNEILNNLSGYKVVIATTLADEGVSFKDLDVVIIASGQASRVKAIQRLGRGTRGFPKKKSFIVVDFIDRNTIYAYKRTEDRLRAYLQFATPTKMYKINLKTLEQLYDDLLRRAENPDSN